jgi:DUF2934 family protein
MDQELEDRIRQRAYDLWLQSGQLEGSEMDFWLQAEHEIKGDEAEAPGVVEGPESRPDPEN